jgi:hypothetical protein
VDFGELFLSVVVLLEVVCFSSSLFLYLLQSKARYIAIARVEKKLRGDESLTRVIKKIRRL